MRLRCSEFSIEQLIPGDLAEDRMIQRIRLALLVCDNERGEGTLTQKDSTGFADLRHGYITSKDSLGSDGLQQRTRHGHLTSEIRNELSHLDCLPFLFCKMGRCA